MNTQLKIGEIKISESGSEYKIIELLGEGGQGEVYKVKNGTNFYALKWYFKNSATKKQKEILENLIANGKPNVNFLWPLDMIYDGERFGYIMELRPKNYKSIVDLMKRRVEPSFYHLCKAAFNLVRSYQQLHSMGYSYRDISFGNLFFNPDSGEVLICDNDNVSVNDKDDCSVYGTPRFMAPEIVEGKAKPSRNTDLYSLSVLLFYMLMLNHPLEGKKETKIRCLDLAAMNKLYGAEPIFIFDPNDESNRPEAGYHDNAIIYWELYPKKLRDLFIQAFTIGLKNPQKRVTEGQWSAVFAEMLGEIVFCNECGAEVFYDIDNNKKSCWNCKKNTKAPNLIKIGRKNIIIHKKMKMYSHHIFDNYDMQTEIAEIVLKAASSPEVKQIAS